MTDRVALVTGGASGIGWACAERLAQAGLRVALTWHSRPPKSEEFLAVRCDVRSQADIEAAFREVEDNLGPVEVLVCAAGITKDRLAVRMSDADWSEVIETNLGGSWRAARRAIPSMLKARWGRILMIGSVVGHMGNPGQANYAASKAGLLGMARSLARELASRNITVNVVAPGAIDTEMLRSTQPRRLEQLVSMVPMGRAGTPAEVAAAVAFLASEEAGYITGAMLAIDGGLGMGA